jgi:hypothetical protein
MNCRRVERVKRIGVKPTERRKASDAGLPGRRSLPLPALRVIVRIKPRRGATSRNTSEVQGSLLFGTWINTEGWREGLRIGGTTLSLCDGSERRGVKGVRLKGGLQQSYPYFELSAVTAINVWGPSRVLLVYPISQII